MVLYGMHINDDPTKITDELYKIKEMKCTFVQLFVYPDFKYLLNYNIFNEYAKKNNIGCVVHASYTINIAADWDEYSWHVDQLVNEIELANKINAIGIVVHIGKQLHLSREQAYNNMYTFLLYVHNKTSKYSNIKIILETPSGQGSEMCYTLEDFGYFFKKFSMHKKIDIQMRFRICIDTCHIFSAGYDIRTKKQCQIFIDSLDKIIGLDYISVIHLNDSKREIGSRVDRHAGLGKGKIGNIGLEYISDFFMKKNIPIVLETPSDHHVDEVKKFFMKNVSAN